MSKSKTIWRILLSLVIMAGFALVAIFLFLKLDLAETFPEPLIITIISLVTISAGACFLVLLDAPMSYSLLVGTSSLKRNMTWGLLGGVLISILNFPYGVLTKQIEAPEGLIIELDSGLTLVWIYLIISIVLLPIVEEIYFRGCLYRLIRNSFDIFWGLFVSTVFFLIGHEFKQAEHIFWMAVSSGLLTYIYQKTASSLASGVAHCFWSLSWFLAYYADYLEWI